MLEALAIFLMASSSVEHSGIVTSKWTCALVLHHTVML